MIIKVIKSKGVGPGATKALLDYLVSDGKAIGYSNEHPKDIGKDLILTEAYARKNDKCHSHIITSVRFDENPNPQFWKQVEMEVKHSLGMVNHPHFSATHYETDCHHLHMLIGCVDMENGRIKKNVWGSYHKLGEVRNNLEKAYALGNSNKNSKGINSRSLSALRPHWDSEYQAQKNNVIDMVSGLSESVESWDKLRDDLQRHHRMLLLSEKNKRDFAIFDELNRWLFEGFDNILLKMESKLGSFPFEIVASVPSYLKGLDRVSLRPRATKGGIGLFIKDLLGATKAIEKAFPDSLISRSKKGINKYGESVSVSLTSYGLGRSSLYSNGIEPYTESKTDSMTTSLLANLLVNNGSAGVQQNSKMNISLITEMTETHPELMKKIKKR